MNQDSVQGEWKQLSGKLKQAWGKLTEDDLLKAEGSIEYLVGKLQEYYGLSKEKVEEGLQELGYQFQQHGINVTERASKTLHGGRSTHHGAPSRSRS